jgi:hypothetical protein
VPQLQFNVLVDELLKLGLVSGNPWFQLADWNIFLDQLVGLGSTDLKQIGCKTHAHIQRLVTRILSVLRETIL